MNRLAFSTQNGHHITDHIRSSLSSNSCAMLPPYRPKLPAATSMSCASKRAHTLSRAHPQTPNRHAILSYYTMFKEYTLYSQCCAPWLTSFRSWRISMLWYIAQRNIRKHSYMFPISGRLVKGQWGAWWEFVLTEYLMLIAQRNTPKDGMAKLLKNKI